MKAFGTVAVLLGALVLPATAQSDELHKVYEDIQHPLYSDSYGSTVHAYKYEHGVLLTFININFSWSRWGLGLLSEKMQSTVGISGTTFIPNMRYSESSEALVYLEE